MIATQIQTTHEPLQKENLANFLSREKQNIDFLDSCIRKNNYNDPHKIIQKIYFASTENGFHYLARIALDLKEAIQKKSHSEMSHYITLMKYYIKMLNTYYFTDDSLQESCSSF